MARISSYRRSSTSAETPISPWHASMGPLALALVHSGLQLPRMLPHRLPLPKQQTSVICGFRLRRRRCCREKSPRHRDEKRGRCHGGPDPRCLHNQGVQGGDPEPTLAADRQAGLVLVLILEPEGGDTKGVLRETAGCLQGRLRPYIILKCEVTFVRWRLIKKF